MAIGRGIQAIRTFVKGNSKPAYRFLSQADMVSAPLEVNNFATIGEKTYKIMASNTVMSGDDVRLSNNLVARVEEFSTLSTTAKRLVQAVNELFDTKAVKGTAYVKTENLMKVVQGVPVGGQKFLDGGTGAIKITFPTKVNYTLIDFDLEIEDNASYGVITSNKKILLKIRVLISDTPNANGSFSSNYKAHIFGDSSYTPKVYFCSGATETYLLVGEITDTYQNAKVVIKNVKYVDGYYDGVSFEQSDLSKNWNISLVTTLETLDSTKKVTVTPSLDTTSLEGYNWATKKGFKYSYTLTASSDTSQFAVFRIADFFATNPTSPIYIEGFTSVNPDVINLISAINGNIGMKRLSLLALQNKTVAYRYFGEDYKETLAYLYYENNDLLIVFNKPNLYSPNLHRLNIYTDISYTVTATSNVTSTTLSTYTLLETLKNSFLEKMPAMTMKGNNTGSTADPKDLTKAEVQAFIQDSTHRMVSDSKIAQWDSTSPAIKYYNTQALAIADEANIAIGNKIRTLGATTINDGLGSEYIIENSLVDGFEIGNGKYANYLVSSAKTPVIGDDSTKIATTAFVNAMLGGNTVPAKVFSANGYVKMANGLIIQWGFHNTASTSGSVSFPTTFPNSCFAVIPATVYSGGGDVYAITITGKSSSGFSWYVGNSNRDIYWVAIGN